MISRSNIKDDVILRPVTCGPDIDNGVCDDLIDEIIRLGDKYSSEK